MPLAGQQVLSKMPVMILMLTTVPRSGDITAGESGSGVVFHRGEGVGRITKPGLPIAVGELAINPVRGR